MLLNDLMMQTAAGSVEPLAETPTLRRLETANTREHAAALWIPEPTAPSATAPYHRRPIARRPVEVMRAQRVNLLHAHR